MGVLLNIFGFINFLVGAWKLYKKAKKEGWKEEGREIVYALENTKDSQERKDLAKRISDHIRNLPK